MKVAELTEKYISKKFFHNDYGILKLSELRRGGAIFYSNFGINGIVTITLDDDEDLVLLGGLI